MASPKNQSHKNESDNVEDPYNKGGFIAFVFSMAFSLIFFVYIAFFHRGVELDEVASSQAGGGATTEASPGGSQSAAPGLDLASVEKPWESRPELIAHGKKVYSTSCAMCHGEKGGGDGPAAATLVPKPRDLIQAQYKYGGDSVSLFKTITLGRPQTGMPMFQHLPAVERWALVHFVRSIGATQVADDSAQLAQFAQSPEGK